MTSSRSNRLWTAMSVTLMAVAVILAASRTGLWPPRALQDASARGIEAQ